MRVTYDPAALIEAARSLTQAITSGRRAQAAVVDAADRARRAFESIERALESVNEAPDGDSPVQTRVAETDTAAAVALLRRNGVSLKGKS